MSNQHRWQPEPLPHQKLIDRISALILVADLEPGEVQQISDFFSAIQDMYRLLDSVPLVQDVQHNPDNLREWHSQCLALQVRIDALAEPAPTHTPTIQIRLLVDEEFAEVWDVSDWEALDNVERTELLSQVHLEIIGALIGAGKPVAGAHVNLAKLYRVVDGTDEAGE